MEQQAASVAPWAELLPEVVQRIAELLDDKGRNAMLRACAAWCAAIQAVPALWPETALFGWPIDYNSWGPSENIKIRHVKQSNLEAADESDDLVETAAGLDRFVWRVLIHGCAEQPMLVHALLAALPPTVRQLRLETECRGPLCTALQHIGQLDSLSIEGGAGNAARLLWRGRGASAVMPKLTALRLDFREQPGWDGEEFEQQAGITPVPEYLPPALAAATRLTRLELLAEWSPQVPQLLAALPALEDLRITLYQCIHSEGLEAVPALEALPRLRTLALTVHSGWRGASEGELDDVDIDGWDEWAYLPPMAGLAGRLTALTLAGAASLPPDWHTLHKLRELCVINGEDWAAELQEIDGNLWGGFDWGSASLSALSSLTWLQLSEDAVLPDAALLASAPNLARVLMAGPEWPLTAPGAATGAPRSSAMRKQLERLRPDIRYID